MSVRLNLLPDLRQQQQQEQSRKRTATVAAVTVCLVSVGVVVLLLVYNGTQKFTINNLSNSISANEAKLSGTPGILDALTTQQNLQTLSGLSSQKDYVSKFFAAYSQLSPTTVAVASLGIDSTNTLKVTGTADTYTTVAKLADAMAADNITVGTGASTSNQPYFTDVTIGSVSKDAQTGSVAFNLTATVATEVTSGN